MGIYWRGNILLVVGEVLRRAMLRVRVVVALRRRMRMGMATSRWIVLRIHVYLRRSRALKLLLLD